MRAAPFLLFFALAFSPTRLLSAPPPSGSRPNIVVFFTDDQSKDSYGRYGGRWLTPRFDQMARDGMALENMYIPTNICTPSRYSMITGRYCDRWYTPYNQTPPNQLNVDLGEALARVGNASESTAATLLRQYGNYTTGFVGKFHMADDTHVTELGLGPVESLTGLNGTALYEASRRNQVKYEAYIRDHGFDYTAAINWENPLVPFDYHYPEWECKGAFDFLNNQTGTPDHPFFLQIYVSMPHGTPNQWENSLNQNITITPDGIRNDLDGVMPSRQSVKDRVTAAGFTPGSADYKKALGYLWLDDFLGAVLDKLDERGFGNNTVVISVADNGTTYKSNLQSIEGTNLPCAIRWRNGITPNLVSFELVSTIDLAATWFDLAGITPPPDYKYDGVSIRELFDDGKAPAPLRNDLFLTSGYARAVLSNNGTSKGYKYIAFRPTQTITSAIKNGTVTGVYKDTPNFGKDFRYTNGFNFGKLPDLHPESFAYDLLYDLYTDPLETKNLAADPAHADILADLKNRLKYYLISFNNNRSFGEFVDLGGDNVPAYTANGTLTNNALTSADWSAGAAHFGHTTPAWFADADQNGLSDIWESNFAPLPPGFSANSNIDGDSLYDAEEFAFGTDPTTPDRSVRLFWMDGHPVVEYYAMFEPGWGIPAMPTTSNNLTTWLAGEGIPTAVTETTETLHGIRYRKIWHFLPDASRAFFALQAAGLTFPEPPPPSEFFFMKDDFAYSATGTPYLANGLSGGEGWGSNNWTATTGSQVKTYIFSGGLTFASPYYTSGNGTVHIARQMVVNSSDANAQRSFPQPIPSNSTVWISLLTQYNGTNTVLNTPPSNIHETALTINPATIANATVQFYGGGSIGTGTYNTQAGFTKDISNVPFRMPPATDAPPITNAVTLHLIKFETDYAGGPEDRITWYWTSNATALTSNTTATLANFKSLTSNATGDWWGNSLSSIGFKWANPSNATWGGTENDRAIDNLRIIAGAASDDEAISALLSGTSP